MRAVMIAYHVTPARNLERIVRDGLLARKGRRSRACGEEARAVWLFADRDALIYGFDNWIERLFDDRTKLALLAVDITGLPIERNGVELACHASIGPERIGILSLNVDALGSADLSGISKI
jgi:hypothetical protein